MAIGKINKNQLPPLKTVNNIEVWGTGNIVIETSSSETHFREYTFTGNTGTTLDTSISLSDQIVVFKNGQKLEEGAGADFTRQYSVLTFTTALIERDKITVWNAISSLYPISDVVVRSDVMPTSEHTLIWIDTSVVSLITADDKHFITSDDKRFVVKEYIPTQLLTADDKNFIDANENNFILMEE